MQLLTFKTLWGHPDLDRADSLELACAMARAGEFNGLEGPIPVDPELAEKFAGWMNKYKLYYIAEVCTAGSYVPDRRATPADHLADLEQQLSRLGSLQPTLVNCIGGCDAWPIDDSLYFFARAQDIAARHGVSISFETHRGRSLYSPWVTRDILQQLELSLTCDFSHWCVVCEGLSANEDELIRHIAQYAVHIHGRVGYDQGPQVADPESILYFESTEQHWRWWRWIWQVQQANNSAYSLFTPEFGPDGYQMRDPLTGLPHGNLTHFNLVMSHRARREFSHFTNPVH